MIFVVTLLTVATLSFTAGCLATGKIVIKTMSNRHGSFIMIGVRRT